MVAFLCLASVLWGMQRGGLTEPLVAHVSDVLHDRALARELVFGTLAKATVWMRPLLVLAALLVGRMRLAVAGPLLFTGGLAAAWALDGAASVHAALWLAVLGNSVFPAVATVLVVEQAEGLRWSYVAALASYGAHNLGYAAHGVFDALEGRASWLPMVCGAGCAALTALAAYVAPRAPAQPSALAPRPRAHPDALAWVAVILLPVTACWLVDLLLRREGLATNLRSLWLLNPPLVVVGASVAALVVGLGGERVEPALPHLPWLALAAALVAVGGAAPSPLRLAMVLLALGEIFLQPITSAVLVHRLGPRGALLGVVLLGVGPKLFVERLSAAVPPGDVRAWAHAALMLGVVGLVGASVLSRRLGQTGSASASS